MGSTILAIVLFTLCLATGLVASTPFTSCTTAADPIDFRMQGCTETPCILYKGQDASAEWDFEVLTDTKVLTPRVRASIGPISIPYDIGQANACTSLTNAECPLDKGEVITYALTMPVLAAYPTVSIMTIEFALLNEMGNPEVCFKVPASVRSAT